MLLPWSNNTFRGAFSNLAQVYGITLVDFNTEFQDSLHLPPTLDLKLIVN